MNTLYLMKSGPYGPEVTTGIRHGYYREKESTSGRCSTSTERKKLWGRIILRYVPSLHILSKPGLFDYPCKLDPLWIWLGWSSGFLSVVISPPWIFSHKHVSAALVERQEKSPVDAAVHIVANCADFVAYMVIIHFSMSLLVRIMVTKS